MIAVADTRKHNDSMNCCIHQLFEQQALRQPESVAVVCRDEQLSYGELNRRSNQLARFLRNRGVGPDMPVGLYVERSLDMLIALFGILKAGGAYIPLDPEYPRERLSFMVQDSRAPVLVTQDKLKGNISHEGTQVVCIDAERDAFEREADTSLAGGAGPENLIYIIYTSGSTGTPKGSFLYHRGFMNLLDWYVRDFAFAQSSRTLLMSSLSFDLTQKNIFAPLIAGGRLILLETQHYDAGIILNSIEKHGVTTVNCTPSSFYGLVKNTDHRFLKKLDSLRYVFLGGEPISVTALQHWLKSPFFHAAIVNTYGPTECTDVCAFYRLHEHDYAASAPVPIGKAVPNTELYILDDKLNSVSSGGEGELYIGGVGVGGGYLNRPELTAEKFLQSPFSKNGNACMYRTGDRVRMREDGNIEFLGRIDHQVKIRGFRIELGEIEMQLARHPDVRETLVTAQEGASGESRLVAYIVPRGNASPSVSALRCHLQSALPDYMLPTAWVFLDKMPLSPNGKVDRGALPSPSAERPDLAQAYAPPQTGLEKHLADIWCELLHLDRVGIHDRFFELGGTSVQAIEFISILVRELDADIHIVKFFEEPTIAGFVKFLEKECAHRIAGRFHGRAGGGEVPPAAAQPAGHNGAKRRETLAMRTHLFQKRTEHRLRLSGSDAGSQGIKK
jgi:amino acid adenylation domain-containing protein